MLDAFVQQSIALTVQPTVVLFRNGWDADDAPYPRIAAQICHQRAQQLGHIDTVCLRSPRSAIDLHARRINDVIAHAMRFKKAMEPEPVIASLVAGNDLDRSLKFSASTRADLLDQVKQSVPVTTLQRVSAYFL